MPSWPDSDKEGIVALEYRAGVDVRRLDAVHYSQDWHFDLLDDEEGVSLERIDADGPSQDANNWHSAAATAGFATPADRNSADGEGVLPQGDVGVSPETFSPDQDGHDDILFVNYTVDQPGWTANVAVFDARGRRVRDLVRNQTLDREGFFTWDGTRDSGERARIGVYVVWFEAFALDGSVQRFKERCVLAGEL